MPQVKEYEGLQNTDVKICLMKCHRIYLANVE